MNIRYYSDAAGTVPIDLASAPVGTVIYMRIYPGSPPVPAIVQSKAP